MKTIEIMAQAFYGNRTLTKINPENIDGFILGYLGNSISLTEDIDRTIIRVPGTDSLVIIYNKNQESRHQDSSPLAIIPEKNLEIHSRCIACRIDDDGSLTSLEPEDVDVIIRYFTA